MKGNINLDNSSNYSTEEQRVGTWIDGKPIYRIAMTFTTGWSYGANSYLTFPNAIEDLDQILKVEINAKRSNGYGAPFPAYHSNETWITGIVNINNTHCEIWIGKSYNNIETINLILKYTKTTD